MCQKPAGGFLGTFYNFSGGGGYKGGLGGGIHHPVFSCACRHLNMSLLDAIFTIFCSLSCCTSYNLFFLNGSRMKQEWGQSCPGWSRALQSLDPLPSLPPQLEVSEKAGFGGHFSAAPKNISWAPASPIEVGCSGGHTLALPLEIIHCLCLRCGVCPGVLALARLQRAVHCGAGPCVPHVPFDSVVQHFPTQCCAGWALSPLARLTPSTYTVGVSCLLRPLGLWLVRVSGLVGPLHLVPLFCGLMPLDLI